MTDTTLISNVADTRSGSVDDVVASHNQHGPYFRNRTFPFDPLTSRQAARRLDFAFLGARWVNNLTDLDRETWHLYGNNVPIPNRLGDSRHLSGQLHWMRSGMPRSQAGLSTAFQAPSIYNLGPFTPPTFRVVAPLQVLQVRFERNDDWANETGSAMLVYVSASLPTTVNFFKGPYRFATVILGNDLAAPPSPKTFLSPFPILARMRMFFRVRVTRLDNRLSPSFRAFDDA